MVAQKKLIMSIFRDLPVSKHVSQVKRSSGGSFFFLLYDLGFTTLCWSSLSCSLLSSSKSFWVSKNALDVSDFLHWEFNSNSDSSDILEGRTNQMMSRGSTWVANSDGETSNAGEGLSENATKNFIIDGEDCWFVNLSRIEELLDLKGVLEWKDVEELKEVSFGSTNLFAFLDQKLLTCDFDGTLENLGLDVEGVKNGNLCWGKCCPHWENCNIAWSDSTNLSKGTDAVLVNDFLNKGEGTVGEAKANTVEEQILKWGNVRKFSFKIFNSTAHEGVLTEANFSNTGKFVTDLKELGSINVHCCNNDNLAVLAEKTLKFLTELNLSFGNNVAMH